ncbi:MAG: HD domain-containing protein [Sporomusaceae bacterium]|nr:HD domain-containing protein [Sporomusaceae bacterium]
MNKIFTVQSIFLAEINKYAGPGEADRDYPLDWERIHMASCGRLGQLLAVKRGVDPEMAAIATSLHDYGRVITGRQAGHAEAAYEPLIEFLTNLRLFTSAEIESLALAAKHHSSKEVVGTPLEEIVKDADVLDCYQYGQTLVRQEQRERLAQVQKELGLI